MLEALRAYRTRRCARWPPFLLAFVRSTEAVCIAAGAELAPP